MMRLVGIAFTTVCRMPLRSSLTALSLVLGVMALTSVAAAHEVMSETITRSALLTGGPIATSEIPITDRVDPVGAATRWQRSIGQRYGAAAHTAVLVDRSDLSVAVDGTPRPELSLSTVDPDLVGIRPFEALQGSWFGAGPPTLAPALVINKAAADSYTATAEWSLRWGSSGQQMTATVTGVVNDGSTTPTGYLNLTQPGPWAVVDEAGVTVSVLTHIEGVNHIQLRSALTQTGAITGSGDQLGDIRRTDTVGELSAELNINARVFIAVSIVALIIAGVGMLNIGLSTLAERSDELSLRRAFGAHRADIVALMLIEAQIVALLAGGTGVIAAYLAMPYTLAAFGATTANTQFPYIAALAGVCSGAIAALIGALTPALRAMNTPIATIMRG